MTHESPRQNIEIKARVSDAAALLEAALALPARDCGVLRQVDTYFVVPHGRLKLRVIDEERAELIFYERPDLVAARRSEYRIAPIAEPGPVLAVLTAGLGVRARVEKRRHLLVYRHTRIHLDDVVGLGEFVELETVMESLSEEEGREESAALMEALGIRPEELVGGSYGEMG